MLLLFLFDFLKVNDSVQFLVQMLELSGRCFLAHCFDLLLRQAGLFLFSPDALLLRLAFLDLC